ncbi:MAG: VCBS repeat-containing protein [Deltaproteobacteria bacterium]|nr:VCBS repeat-containing protein [Deltaproteobacteria bacterium]
MRYSPFLLGLLACSDWNLEGIDNKDGNIDGEDTAFDPEQEDLGACDPEEFSPEPVALSDTCHFDIGGFEPVVSWEVDGNAASLPAVGDINSDGMPEIVITWGWLFEPYGELAAYKGDGSGMLWQTSGASIGYGSGPTLADLDGDGQAEIIAVKLHEYSLISNSPVSVVMYDSEGNFLGESQTYTDGEFDHVTGIVVSDMDHDGHAEIVAGRVILNDDLTERGVGRDGRGCDNYFGIGGLYGEGATPAVADMDLDGVEEVVVGNAFYDPDGHTIMEVRGGPDGAPAIANLDGDPEGEFVRATYSELVAIDTDGTELWTYNLPGGGGDNSGIMSVPTIGDIDGDGLPEVVAARANYLWAVNGEDGSVLWSARITDSTGATGASLFDFEGDGVQEVVYIDEVAMYAFDGTNGDVKFKSDEHNSDTMYDYPTIADVDADGHADIVVAHDQNFSAGPGFSVYRDATNSWAPARSVWNMHAYDITHINDDLTVPTTAVQNFTTYNNFHSAHALAPGEALGDELSAEILSTCDNDCDRGWYLVTARAQNTGSAGVAAGVSLSLYAEIGGSLVNLATETLADAIASGMTSEAVIFAVQSSDIEKADKLWVYVDDNGSRTGFVSECDETNNGAMVKKPFCSGK